MTNTITSLIMNNKNSNLNNVSKNINKNLNTSTNNKKGTNITKILIICLIILIILALIYVLINYYNYSKIDCYQKKSFKDYLFGKDKNVCILYDKPIPKPVVTVPKSNPPKMGGFLEKDEVFHISNQDYSYEQSKCKCASYGARLATKNEVTNAYNNGANWCSYGWTEGQNAFYPVQKCYYDSLMEESGFLENSDKYCGKPGLNGGYFSNPELRFGVNCYGKKPKGQVIKPKSAYCPPKEFCKLNKNSNANQRLSTDEIAPFNDQKWNY